MEQNLQKMHNFTTACWKMYKRAVERLNAGEDDQVVFRDMAEEAKKIGGPVPGWYVAKCEDWWRGCNV